MSESDAALQRILVSLDEGKDTKTEDWRIIFKSLVGVDDAETISKVQKFIKDNFSFKIENGAEGIAYYGKTGATIDTIDAPGFMVVDTLVKKITA